MSSLINNESYDWMQVWEKANLVLSFKGDFNHDLINSLVYLTEERTQLKNACTQSRKRIFGTMVECMQNICKHGISLTDDFELKPGILLIGSTNNHYIITTGNFIWLKEKEKLKNYLQQLISLDNESLNKIQSERINTAVLSDKSGGGLGLINMARNAEKIDYGFRDHDSQLSFFTFEITVPFRLKGEI